MSEFYSLPADKIAQFPPKLRGASRLLVVDRHSERLTDRRYAELAELLVSGDVLVLNETKVLPARLITQLADGRERELMLTEKHGRALPEGEAIVVYRGKLRAGDELIVGKDSILVVEIMDGGQARVASRRPLSEVALEHGAPPLPPYIRRAAEASDVSRYQTVFARQSGSVAAPTASLNLTDELLAAVKSRGVTVANLTLHVGRGTFLPIRTEQIDQHTMHEEYFEIPADTIEMIRQTKDQGGRIVAVGTTVTRALEYAASDILGGGAEAITGEADIFIYPGYQFRVVDALLTNFHAPDSTVIQLAAAFAGGDLLKKAYDHAIDSNYRFLSYGDSMLIV